MDDFNILLSFALTIANEVQRLSENVRTSEGSDRGSEELVT